MIILEMKNYNMIATEKLAKYRPYYQAELISINILLVKKYFHLVKQKIIEQVNLIYSHLGKSFEKEIKTIEYQGKKKVED